MTKKPNSRANLDRAIERIFGNYEKSLETRSIMANAIVGQMLRGGVVKGGSGLKLRYGTSRTRATMDLDTACRGDIPRFVQELSDSLRTGWCGFSGTVVKRNPAKPKNVPPQYVMQPYSVRLAYNGQPWCTVELEVGFNELGDADEPDFALSDEVAQIFAALGFPVPDAVPLMKCEHQMAQKLHGLTEPGSRRVHDLVDLQLMVDRSQIDFAELERLCRRLFAFRRLQDWPPKVAKGTDWESMYRDANFKRGVTRTLDEAIDWANALIAKICAAQGDSPAPKTQR